MQMMGGMGGMGGGMPGYGGAGAGAGAGAGMGGMGAMGGGGMGGMGAGGFDPNMAEFSVLGQWVDRVESKTKESMKPKEHCNTVDSRHCNCRPKNSRLLNIYNTLSTSCFFSPRFVSTKATGRISKPSVSNHVG